MAGYLSKSFDPEAVATTSDAASSALYAISTQSAAWEAAGGLFEVDINGDVEPITETISDQYYELDDLSNIMPKAA